MEGKAKKCTNHNLSATTSKYSFTQKGSWKPKGQSNKKEV